MITISKRNADKWFDEQQLSELTKVLDAYSSMYERLKKSFPCDIRLGIAGGAIRDLFLKKEITDLDFFVDVNRENATVFENTLSPFEFQKLGSRFFTNRDLHPIDQNETCFTEVMAYQNILKSEWSKKFDIVSTKNGIYFGLANVGLLKIKDFEGFPVDLIFIKDSLCKFMKENFDFNLCRIHLGMNNQKEWYIDLSEEFIMDAMQKKITFNNDAYHEAQILRSFNEHLPRISAKYNDFSINCVQGENFIKENGLIIYQDSLLNKNIGEVLTGYTNKRNKV